MQRTNHPSEMQAAQGIPTLAAGPMIRMATRFRGRHIEPRELEAPFVLAFPSWTDATYFATWARQAWQGEGLDLAFTIYQPQDSNEILVEPWDSADLPAPEEMP